MSAKAMGYLAEMPALTSITIKTAHGFETGQCLQKVVLVDEQLSIAVTLLGAAIGLCAAAAVLLGPLLLSLIRY